MRLPAACALAVALAAGSCTTQPSAGPGSGHASPAVAPRPQGPAPSSQVRPEAETGPGPQRRTEPLVLVTHTTRPPLDVFEEVGLRIIRGDMATWAELGVPGTAGVGPEPGRGPTRLRVVSAPGTRAPERLEVASARAALRAVVRDRDTVGIVPAGAVGPGVRPMRVNGFDPMREPGRYPIRAPLPARSGDRGPVVTMTVVGDIMLGRGVARSARGHGVAPALAPTRRRLAAADITVGNLESTLSRAGTPMQGGDSFAADPGVVRGLLASGFDVLGLANNHVGDFGDRALVQTLRRLRSAGLATFGAGSDPRQARSPALLGRRGTTYGFLGFNAIGETPAVAPGRPGAVQVSMPPRTGPLDRAELARFLRSVRRLDRAVDVVVVLPHWGTQYTNRPEPVQRRVARRVVAAGADLVVGGHPHWVQGVQMVDGVLVAHSLGNFVFDMDFMQETREGLILELTFWGAELKAARFVPYLIDDTFAPRVVTYRRGLDVLWRMRATSGVTHRG